MGASTSPRTGASTGAASSRDALGASSDSHTTP